MGERPAGEGQSEDGADRSDETAKLELPSLSLPRLGRRLRRRRDDSERTVERPETSDPVDRSPGTTVLPDPVEQDTRTEPDPILEPAPLVAPDSDPDSDADRDPDTRTRRPLTLPQVPDRTAAAITGGLVGLLGAVLTYASLRVCGYLRGTETCGAVGLPVLLLILVVMVLIGSALLSRWGLSDAGSTSLLGVGVLCVVVLLVLQPLLVSAVMFVLAPLVAALGFALAHWVTTAFIEPTPERGPEHDVR